MSTRNNDDIREIFRRLGELESAGARRVVREPQASPATIIRAYKLAACDLSGRLLYASNKVIAQHLDEVAVVRDSEGVDECWAVIGPAEECATGQCVEIIGWLDQCTQCLIPCFLLTPCDTGITRVVRGFDWLPYMGGVVYLDNAAESVVGCYEVTAHTTCADANDNITADDIVDDFASCTTCNDCYEVTSCADPDDIRIIGNNLGGASALGKIFREVSGACWEVTDYFSPCGVSPEFLDLEEDSETASCDECCYLFTPCPGNEEPPFKARTDPDGEPLEALVNKAVMLAGFECYTVTREIDCTGAVVGIPTLIESYADCNACHLSRWQECGTSNKIRTWSNLFAYETSSTILRRAEDGKCYEYFDAGGSETPVEFTVEVVFPSCDCCEDPKYKLTPTCGDNCLSVDCGGEGPPTPDGDSIVTGTDLSTAVGQFVKVDGQCYFVECTSDEITRSGVCWTGPFPTCIACNSGESMISFVIKAGSEFVISHIKGNFQKCGESPATEECPTPAAAAASAYALASLI